MTVITILSNIALFCLIVQALATKLQRNGYVFCIHMYIFTRVFRNSKADDFCNAYINAEIQRTNQNNFKISNYLKD